MDFPPSLDQWDEAFLLQVAAADESLELEKKASPTLEPPAPDGDEVYKQASPFANSAGGYVGFGIDKDRKLDAGVPLRLGRTDITDAVSKRIADNLQPHLHGYRVHAITLPKYHKPDRCILVLQLPLS